MPKQRKPARSNSRKRPPATRVPKISAKQGKPAAAPFPDTPSKRPSKKATVLGLLKRPGGAAIGELTEATGWQSHSIRATLTGFRKEGQELIRAKDETGVTRYRLAAA